jgi:DNA-directed RNA polymerase specialized sigma24 family protein
MIISKLSDIELFTLFSRDNDRDAIVILFSRYSHLVYGVCKKYLKSSLDAEDAVMSVFATVLETGRDQQFENFTLWLHALAKRQCCNESDELSAESEAANTHN